MQQHASGGGGKSDIWPAIGTQGQGWQKRLGKKAIIVVKMELHTIYDSAAVYFCRKSEN